MMIETGAGGQLMEEEGCRQRDLTEHLVYDVYIMYNVVRVVKATGIYTCMSRK